MLTIIVVMVLCLRFEPADAQFHAAFIATDEGAYVSNGSIPAAELAMDQVNAVFNFSLHLNFSVISVSRFHLHKRGSYNYSPLAIASAK